MPTDGGRRCRGKNASGPDSNTSDIPHDCFGRPIVGPTDDGVRSLLDAYASHVTATPASIDVLPRHVVGPERLLERFVQVLRWMAVIAVRDQIDVIAGCRVPYRVDRLCDDKVDIGRVPVSLQVRRPRVVVYAVGDRLRLGVIAVAVARGFHLRRGKRGERRKARIRTSSPTGTSPSCSARPRRARIRARRKGSGTDRLRSHPPESRAASEWEHVRGDPYGVSHPNSRSCRLSWFRSRNLVTITSTTGRISGRAAGGSQNRDRAARGRRSGPTPDGPPRECVRFASRRSRRRRERGPRDTFVAATYQQHTTGR